MTANDLNTILEIGMELSKSDIKPYLFLGEKGGRQKIGHPKGSE